MEAALFHPRHGYYAGGRARIGKSGDFYTSVSVGPLYGRLLAWQVGEIATRIGGGDTFTIIEQGGHDGVLAADVLDALRAEHAGLYSRTRYVLVEPFAANREARSDRLEAHAPHVDWAADLAALEPVDGVHFSNEYADALPVRLFVRRAGAWRERGVRTVSDTLEWCDLDPQSDPPPSILPDDAEEGTVWETRPAASAWIRSACRVIRRGVVLVADYGYPRAQLYAPWRTEGTLACFSAHHRDSNPLENPGHKDITAHVDFTDLADAAGSAGFVSAGFADQCHFLTGIFGAMADRAEFSQKERQAFLTLTHPEMMGTQFKFLALSRGVSVEPPLAGLRYGGSVV